MDFFSNSKPNLLASDLKNNYNSLFLNNHNTATNPIHNLPNDTYTTPIKDINKVFYSLYTDYIIDNIYLIIVILGIILFLYYRYCNKKDMESYLDEPFIRPVFNPYYPVHKQINYNVYPSGRLPLKSDNPNNVLDYIGDPKIYDNTLNNDQYNMTITDIINKEKRVIPGQYYPQTLPNYGLKQNTDTIYTGVTDTYKNDIYKSHTIPNPLGFKTNFNETAGKFSQPMTQANMKNLDNYVQKINNDSNSLETSAYNIENIDYVDDVDFIEPPYAN